MEAQERAGQKSLEMIKARNELEKARVGVMKAQAAALDDELAKSKQSSKAFGSMDSVAQRGFADAAKRFKTGGRDSVTQEEYNQIQNGLECQFQSERRNSSKQQWHRQNSNPES